MQCSGFASGTRMSVMPNDRPASVEKPEADALEAVEDRSMVSARPQ